LNYQWQRNGTNIPGATSPTLWLTNCQYSHSGAYRVFLDNGLDTTNSLEAILDVAQVASWGSAGQATVPPGLSGLARLAAGARHTTAFKATGTAVSWGNGYTNVPASATNLVTVAAGGDKGWGLREDGSIVGWKGATPTLSTIPTDITNVLAIAAGVSHDLALLPDHTVATWGANSQGQTSLPAGLTNVVAVAAGAYHSLALKADGTVIAWGANGTGQTNVPAGLTNAVAVAAGTVHSMALTADGRVSVWGQTFGTIPVSATNVVAIAAGYGHCLGLRADGTVVAWGYYYNGETNVPAGLKNVSGITARDFSSQALVADGTPRPRLLLANPRWGAEGFAVTVASRSGRVYQLEFNDSLASDLWTALPLVAGRGGLLDLTDPTAVGSHRFYRVREW
jgi:alpha-tubulin suppressor-like RCC1 family protein